MTTSAARRARHWRREDVDRCTGGRRFSTRTQGAVIRYLGLGRWNPVAWWYSQAVKCWPMMFDIGKAMRTVNRWLSTREAAKPRTKSADGLASRPLKRGRR